MTLPILTANATNSLRIPNLPIGPIVDKDGNATQNEQLFRQNLINLLQTFIGSEGLIAPSQTSVAVQTILTNISNTNPNVSSALPGTIIYQQADNNDAQTGWMGDKLVVFFRNSDATGAQPKAYYINVTAL